MDSIKTRSGRQSLAGLVLVILTLAPAAAQDAPPEVKTVAPAAAQDAPPEPKKAPQDAPPEPKKAVLTVVVKTDDHKDIPASARVQVTFHDRTCGGMYGSPDKYASIVNGRARFDNLIVCALSIKVDVPGYLNSKTMLTSASFKPEIEITLEHESK